MSDINGLDHPLLMAIEAVDRARGRSLSPMQKHLIEQWRADGVKDDTIERLLCIKINDF